MDEFIFEKENSDATKKQSLEDIHLVQKNLHQFARSLRNKEIGSTSKENLKSREFGIGDIVMKRREDFERENKLDSKWSGPYTVVQSFENGGYEIENPRGKLFRYNIKDLRRMEGSDPETWAEIGEEEMLDAEEKIKECSLIINLLN